MVDPVNDMIGTCFAILGAIMASLTAMSIRILTHYGKLHYMVVPMGYAIGNMFLCPLFMTIKVLLGHSYPERIIDNTIHLVTSWDSWMIGIITFSYFFQQIFQT